MTYHIGAHYTEYATDSPRIARAARQTLPGVEFDTVVGIGVSGALALGVVAVQMAVPNVLILRKDTESSHSHSLHEGSLGKRWLFVDDFIDTGSTFRGVHDRVCDLARDLGLEASFAGAFLYAHQDARGEYFSPSRAYDRADMPERKDLPSYA